MGATALRATGAVLALAALAHAAAPVLALPGAPALPRAQQPALPGAPAGAGPLAAIATSWTTLVMGQMVAGFLPVNASTQFGDVYNFYNYTHLTSNTGFKVYLYPQGATGDADLFVSDATNPSPQYGNAIWSCMTDFTDVVAVPASACPVAPCTFYMSATPYYQTNTSYLILVANIAAPAMLQAGQSQSGFVTSNDWNYYNATWTPTSMSDRYTLSLSHVNGDPDM